MIKSNYIEQNSNDVMQCGFTIVIDMRSSSWNVVKSVLKLLHENFPAKVNALYVIKADNFWQKRRVNFSSNKYNFEVL